MATGDNTSNSLYSFAIQAFRRPPGDLPEIRTANFQLTFGCGFLGGPEDRYAILKEYVYPIVPSERWTFYPFPIGDSVFYYAHVTTEEAEQLEKLDDRDFVDEMPTLRAKHPVTYGPDHRYRVKGVPGASPRPWLHPKKDGA